MQHGNGHPTEDTATTAMERCAFSTTFAQPITVKNTFFEFDDGSHNSTRREHSAPPPWSRLVTEEEDGGECVDRNPRRTSTEMREKVVICGWDKRPDEAEIPIPWDVDHSQMRLDSRQVTVSTDVCPYSEASTDSIDTSPVTQSAAASDGRFRMERFSWADADAMLDDVRPAESCGQELQVADAVQEQQFDSRNPMPWSGAVTTVMVRQIPRNVSQLQLIKEVGARGYAGTYDFLYLPYDAKKKINVGYGFLNFVSPGFAEAFRQEFDGAYLDKRSVSKGKPLHVHPARTQGYEANYEHFVQTKTWQKQDPNISPLFCPRGATGTLPFPAYASPQHTRGGATGTLPSPAYASPQHTRGGPGNVSAYAVVPCAFGSPAEGGWEGAAPPAPFEAGWDRAWPSASVPPFVPAAPSLRVPTRDHSNLCLPIEEGHPVITCIFCSYKAPSNTRYCGQCGAEFGSAAFFSAFKVKFNEITAELNSVQQASDWEPARPTTGYRRGY